MDQFWFYFKLGFDHVFDLNAYDHLLFFIALIVPYTFANWKRAFWLVTLFAIGHTISLILATYGVVHINASLVECLIPITIFITALFHVFTAGRKNYKESYGLHFFVTLFFGMIHGLGFSSYFRQVVASSSNKLVPLLEFALGIEAAQLLVVFLVLLAAFILQTIFRFNKRDWILVVASIVIGVVIPLLLETCLRGS